MKRLKLLPKIALLTAISIVVLFVVFLSFYSYWNAASPEKTCASCHEIEGAVHLLSQSSHRELACKECHGTALSNGIHSLKEKAMMVVHHVNKEQTEDIRMNETQMLGVMENCRRCHASEYAGWKTGGHSVRYKYILLNETHNRTEQLNYDCLRCHGMYYNGKVTDLVSPIDTLGPWKMKDEREAGLPAIPCMACHQVHTEGTTGLTPDYAKPASVFYSRRDSLQTVPGTGFYVRSEKIVFPASDLPELKLTEGKRTVKVSDDPQMRICIQCHAPDGWHEAGTGDDRTPRGVHEGLSCVACHSPHSNDAANSCKNCHPAISNCGLDVTKMNTTYADAGSPNNIHWVSCNDCHQKNMKNE